MLGASILSGIVARNLSGLGCRLGVTDEADGIATEEIRRMRFEEAYGIWTEGRLTQASCRRAPVDEVLAVADWYKSRFQDWNVKHLYNWYQRDGGTRSYTWVTNTLLSKGLVARTTKKGAHRKRKERALLPGMMTHQDGSNHEWVPGRSGTS